MSTDAVQPNFANAHELHSLRNHWWCFLLLGAALVVIGSLCIMDPLVPSLASVLVLGFLLIAAGIVQVVTSFWAGKWSGMLLHILIGVFYAVVGYMIIDSPELSMLMLTKFIAIFLIVSGLFRIVSALVVRFHDWGWVLLSGGVSLLLGIVINRQLPAAALWVVGLFLGIELIFNGWAWIMLALGLRRAAKAT